MEFRKYQELSTRTMNENMSFELANYCMGLAGESGEVVDYLKKIVFHGHDLKKKKIVEELGDVLWYVSAIASKLGIELDHVAEVNIEKLKNRYPNGFSKEASINRNERLSQQR